MSIEGKDARDGMEPEENDALWRLLRRARGAEPSPYFSRRVLREVALLEDARGTGRARVSGWVARWRQAWRWPAAAVWPGAAAIAVFWLSVVLTTPSSTTGEAGMHLHKFPQTSVQEPASIADDPAVPASVAAHAAPAGAGASDADAPQDVEVIADLDNVILREENRLWTEDTARE